MKAYAAILLAFLFVGGAAQAQDALYGKQAPKGSAFVRIVNALAAEAEVKPDFLPTQKLGITPADRVGAYFVVEHVAGRKLQMDIRSASRSAHKVVQAEPDGVLTILLQQAPDGTLLALPIADLASFNQSRTRLAFYNATPACSLATLALDPGGQAVFKAVAPGASQARAVNPVNAQLRASCADLAPPAMALSDLDPGGMVSIWLMNLSGQPTAFISHDVVEPYRP